MATVYVIRAIGVQKIKVGITTDLGRRLSELQAMSPVALEVVATTVGVGFDVEATMHSLMRDHHSHGEWFNEAALPIAIRWIGITESARADVASLIARHVPAEHLSRLPDLLATAGAANIANELTNLTGQSIMDRRYGA